MDALTDHGSIGIGGAPSLSWAAAWRSKTSGLPCGDRHLVRRTGGEVMLAVIDGAGSGHCAARAASACHDALAALDCAAGLETCFAAAHRGCRQTKGAALGLVLIEPASGRFTWGAVGDIDALLIPHAAARRSRREAILQCGGTLGQRLPAILGQTHPIRIGDTLILVSDGVRHTYREAAPQAASVEALAAGLLRDHGRGHDDAIVLVARLEPAA